MLYYIIVNLKPNSKGIFFNYTDVVNVNPITFHLYHEQCNTIPLM